MIAAPLLHRLGACPDAIAWVGECDLATAWAECHRSDWMLWLAARLGVDRRMVVRALCECARTVLPYIRAGENRPRVAVETAEAWCRGEATLEEAKDAADAAISAKAVAYIADAYGSNDNAYNAAAKTHADIVRGIIDANMILSVAAGIKL